MWKYPANSAMLIGAAALLASSTREASAPNAAYTTL